MQVNQILFIFTHFSICRASSNGDHVSTTAPNNSINCNDSFLSIEDYNLLNQILNVPEAQNIQSFINYENNNNSSTTDYQNIEFSNTILHFQPFTPPPQNFLHYENTSVSETNPIPTSFNLESNREEYHYEIHNQRCPGIQFRTTDSVKEIQIYCELVEFIAKLLYFRKEIYTFINYYFQKYNQFTYFDQVLDNILKSNPEYDSRLFYSPDHGNRIVKSLLLLVHISIKFAQANRLSLDVQAKYLRLTRKIMV